MQYGKAFEYVTHEPGKVFVILDNDAENQLYGVFGSLKEALEYVYSDKELDDLDDVDYADDGRDYSIYEVALNCPRIEKIRHLTPKERRKEEERQEREAQRRAEEAREYAKLRKQIGPDDDRDLDEIYSSRDKAGFVAARRWRERFPELEANIVPQGAKEDRPRLSRMLNRAFRSRQTSTADTVRRPAVLMPEDEIMAILEDIGLSEHKASVVARKIEKAILLENR